MKPVKEVKKAVLVLSSVTTARVLASQAEAIVRTGKTWPQATKRRKATKRRN